MVLNFDLALIASHWYVSIPSLFAWLPIEQVNASKVKDQESECIFRSPGS